MTTSKKSNVTRMLDARHIPYQAYTYSTDIRSAEDVARVLEAPAHEVYKTLGVLPPRGKPLLVIIPGPRALDLKRLALALPDRGFQVCVDQVAQTITAFVVSAGQRGMNLRRRVDDFMAVTNARFVEASSDGAPRPLPPG